MANGDDSRLRDLLLEVAEELPPAKAAAIAARLQDHALGKLTESISAFSTKATRQTRWLIGLTVALLACTVALIALTAMLVWPGSK